MLTSAMRALHWSSLQPLVQALVQASGGGGGRTSPQEPGHLSGCHWKDLRPGTRVRSFERIPRLPFSRTLLYLQ